MFWVVAEGAQAVVDRLLVVFQQLTQTSNNLNKLKNLKQCLTKLLASALAVGARFKQAKKFQEELDNLLVDTLFE